MDEKQSEFSRYDPKNEEAYDDGDLSSAEEATEVEKIYSNSFFTSTDTFEAHKATGAAEPDFGIYDGPSTSTGIRGGVYLSKSKSPFSFVTHSSPPPLSSELIPPTQMASEFQTQISDLLFSDLEDSKFSSHDPKNKEVHNDGDLYSEEEATEVEKIYFNSFLTSTDTFETQEATGAAETDFGIYDGPSTSTGIRRRRIYLSKSQAAPVSFVIHSSPPLPVSSELIPPTQMASEFQHKINDPLISGWEYLNRKKTGSSISVLQSSPAVQTFSSVSGRESRTEAIQQHLDTHINHQNFPRINIEEPKELTEDTGAATSLVMSKLFDLTKSPEMMKLTCDICGKISEKKVSLTRHLHIHFDERTRVCEICQKSLSNKDALVRHIRTIHERKPIKVQSKNQGNDDDENRFPCPFCSEKFPNKHRRRYHIKSKHNHINIIKQFRKP